MSKEIIGITGPIGAGKTTASEILQSEGYVRFSFSDAIKKEAAKRGLPINDRSILQDVGDDLRKTYGQDVLAKRTLESFGESGEKNAVIDGIRNPGELKSIQEAGGFVIGIDSPFDSRVERVIHRGNPYDPKSAEEFEEDELRDRGFGQDEYGQQTDECLRLADRVIENNGTIEEFKKKILDTLNAS